MIRRRFLRTVSGSIIALSGCNALSDSKTTPTTETNAATESNPTPTEESATMEAEDDASSQESEANKALVIESYAPISGTNVNVGARGIGKNNSGRWLVDCVLDITGVVGEQTFSAQATRSPLAPHGTWEWKVPFGRKADALSDGAPEQIEIKTRAEFMDWE